MDHLLNTKCDIQEVTRTDDAYSTWTESWSDLYADLPCRIRWSRGAEMLEYGTMTHFRDARVYCAVKTDITVEHRLVYNDVKYQIVDVSNVGEADRFMVIDIKKMPKDESA